MRKLKTVLFAVALFMGTSLSAQLPISLGLKGGLNLSNLTDDADAKAKVGFNVGLTADLSIPMTPLYVGTGIEYTTKGCSSDGDEDLSINLGYIQVPVHLGYKFSVPGASIKLHAGPYVAYGIGGKTSSEEDGLEVRIDSFQDGLFKKFDFGAGVGAGVGFGPLEVGLGWDFGLVDINDFNEASVKTQNGYLTVGYKF